MKLGVLVSGHGSNLEAVLGARIPAVDVAIVVSNRPGVRALEVAERFGTPTRVMPRADFADGESRDAAIGRTLAAAGCDLALLAGYDQLLTGGYFATFEGRTINIHPSLLPAHGGRGMLGMAVHAAVLAAGEIESGATIHEVTPELDAGPILAQARVPVRPDDDPARLAERVLQAEHRLLVEAIAGLAAGRSIGMPRARMAGASAVRADSHETHERPLPHA